MTTEQEDYNRFIGKHRAIVENINVDLKSWGILQHYNGEDLEFLLNSFILIANIINLKNFGDHFEKDEFK